MPRGPGETQGSPSDPERPPISIPVIATLSGPDGDLDESFLNGMTLARERINGSGGIGGRSLELPLDSDEDGDAAVTTERLRAAVAGRPPAVLVAGPAEGVAAARDEIVRARTPVILLGGDLYTGQHLHRYAFQTSVPVRWQARVLAAYLFEDRGYRDVAMVTNASPTGEAAAAAVSDAFAEEERPPPRHVRVHRPRDAASEVDGADAAVVLLPPHSLGRALDAIAGLTDPPQLALPPEAVVTGPPSHAPDTVLCTSYTWAGWADMLPRVHAFRAAYMSGWGEAPTGLEQEGYDAVMAVAEALKRTDGEGGDALVRALEGFRDETYSSLPIRLGPDDHVFAEESHLGLFAVADPTGAPSGEAFGQVPWRPVMRTFTTDGEKVNLLDRDKRIFFPFWRPKRPTPKYWKSEYGIVTRRGEPPV